LKPRTKLKLGAQVIQEGGEATFLLISKGNNLRYLDNIHSGIINRARAENLAAIFMRGKVFYFRKTQEKLRF